MAELSGKESGRAARLEAIRRMLRRREAAKRTMQHKAGSSDTTQRKGIVGRGEDFDVERMIKRSK